jgi:hypothetical protein
MVSLSYNVVMEYIDVLRTMPPLVAALAWDCINYHVTDKTLELAHAATDEEYENYDLVRMLCGGNSAFPEILEALADEGWHILKMMKEEMP